MNVLRKAGMGMMVLSLSLPAAAQEAQRPAIADYGAIATLDEAANRPERSDDMRVLFDIASDARSAEGINRSLDKVARYLNLLASAGVTPPAGDVKVIIHGQATVMVLHDAEYRERFGSSNPNSPLIAALTLSGVDIHVCGQALAGKQIAPETVNPAITIDLSAMTTLVILQREGWPIVSD